MPQIVIKKQGTQWDHYVDQEVYIIYIHNIQRKHSPATDLLKSLYIYLYIITKLYTVDH